MRRWLETQVTAGSIPVASTVIYGVCADVWRVGLGCEPSGLGCLSEFESRHSPWRINMFRKTVEIKHSYNNIWIVTIYYIFWCIPIYVIREQIK